MVAELVEPTQLPSPDGTEKRRGRPPKLNPDGTRANPPKLAKPRRAKRAGSPTRARGPKSLQPEITAFLSLANSLVILSPLGTRPIEAITKADVQPAKIGDELDSPEIELLAVALDKQCQRSPRFRKYVERVLGVGSGGQLVTVLGMIAIRRASRHGLVPEAFGGRMVDPMLGMMMASGDISALGEMLPTTPTAPPDPVTSETEPDRYDGIDYETIGTFSEP